MVLRMARIGASSPLPRVPAMVPSPSGLQTFAIVRCETGGHGEPRNRDSRCRTSRNRLWGQVLSMPEEVIVWAARRFACLELIIPDRDRLTDQTTVRNSSQHMQFFDLFAGLSRDPADCPSVIHRHALFFVRHLYVFRAAQRKSMTIRARERSRYWRGSAHDCALLGREGFLALAGGDLLRQ